MKSRAGLSRFSKSCLVSLIAMCVVATLGAPAFGQADILDAHDSLDDLDNRTGTVAPNATQKAIVDDLGAKVRWNRFGTPQSLIKYGGFLGTVSGDTAAAAARRWVVSNKALFRLSTVTSDNLMLLNDSRMPNSKGHAVVFRQRFGGLELGQDGMITVGLTGSRAAGWKVAYVSSSAVGTQTASAAATLSPTEAWLEAAENVGHNVTSASISDERDHNSWTVFNVAGFEGTQRSRLVAMADPGDGVTAAYETIVLDNAGGHSEAYTIFVDASTGAILFRTNRVAQVLQDPPIPHSGNFHGETPDDGTCGPKHAIPTDANTASIVVLASADIPVDDIVLNILRGDEVVASSDTATSPEVATYSPSPFPAGEYFAQVCEFEEVPSFSYTGAYAVSDIGAPAGEFPPYPPFWKYFKANPLLGEDHPPFSLPDDDTRVTACWDRFINGTMTPDCQLELFNLAARAPWDHGIQSNLPTFTTIGNAAVTGEAWFSPLTPAEQYRPIALDRRYIFPWDNIWENHKCGPTAFGPSLPESDDPLSSRGGRNDIDAATTSLFANHNRMHDWSYFLGFTEENYNMQQNNFGNTSPSRENDPEIGNAQAGALTGGQPSFLGRDNANQITLNDGIPGITNMYLWQPIAGAFYPPCVDGDFDMSVIGHEYTHAISNRMVGGPDAGLTSSADGQARAMGESYSDLTAVEYLHEYGYVPTNDENPFAVGAYVTGEKQAGIRNYGMNKSPLNYSDVQGYDGMGASSPHDDGEIWSAANFDIRKAMNARYNGSFPASNERLQRQCANNVLPVNRCPGNRRWMQIVFDAYLLMPPAVSMLDSRDAYLAADMMRFNGAHQTLLWREFAGRGMGEFASSAGTDDPQPKPNFQTPREAIETTLTFTARAAQEGGAPVDAKIYVGDYEGNVTPAADPDPGTARGRKLRLVPGTYDFVAQADGYGMFRFTRNVHASRTQEITLNMPTNLASRHKGAVAEDADGANNQDLIDDTESTNWAHLGSAPVDTTTPSVTVNLAGNNPKLVASVNVSALLRPPDPDNEQDSASQNRFTALRKFRIETCVQGEGSPCNNETGAGFSPVFTSGDNAFPGDVPRPTAPDLLFKNFDVTNSMATHVRLVVLENQCTGGADFQGDQDNDPTNQSDCKLGSARDNQVRAAELQVFSTTGTLGVPKDPVVVTTMNAPLTASPGSDITYTINYRNLGPAPSSNARITNVLPDGLRFLSANGDGSYNTTARKVTWNLGTVGVNEADTVKLRARVKNDVVVGTAILNQAQFLAPLTVSTPAAALTLVTE